MGGQGSGRKPDPVKALTGGTIASGISIQGGKKLELPNYSGLQEYVDKHGLNFVTLTLGGGSNGELLTFDGERDWAFELQGTGVNTLLVLKDKTGSKDFQIDDDVNNLTYLTIKGSQATKAVIINEGNDTD